MSDETKDVMPPRADYDEWIAAEADEELASGQKERLVIPTKLREIPPTDGPMPEGKTCQEASALSRETYFPCMAPAIAIVFHDRDRRGFYMCLECASHNLHNRGGRLVAVATGFYYDAESRNLCRSPAQRADEQTAPGTGRS